MLYARIQNGAIAELVNPPAGFTLAQSFTPAFVAQCVGVTNETPAPQAGYIATKTNGVWSFAAPPAPPAPTLARQSTAAHNAGLTIASTGPTLTLPATLFPTSGPIWTDLKDQATFIALPSGEFLLSRCGDGRSHQNTERPH